LFIMLLFQNHVIRSFSATSLHRQLFCLQNHRVYSQAGSNREEADLEAAREWYRSFSKSSIPTKVAETTFSRSSGPGGQKVNK